MLNESGDNTIEGAVDGGMIGFVNAEGKIFGSVVIAASVQVMDDFALANGSPKFLLHHKMMLEFPPSRT